MNELFESLMVISFGVSWPISIIKSYTARTAKWKSLAFLLLIMFGYTCGMISKLWVGKITYVFVFYVINFVMVFIDMILYFRNQRLDAKSEISLSNK